MRELTLWITHPHTLCIKIRLDNNTPEWHELAVHEPIDNDLVAMWMLKHLRPYFHAMPFKVSVHIGKVLLDKLKTGIGHVTQWLDATSAALEEHLIPIDGQNTLFVNVSEDLRYKSLHDLLKKRFGDKVHYLNLDLGFDRKTRTWANKQEFLNYPEFIAYLLGNQIGMIITVNSYLTDRYRHEAGILLHPILKRLGVILVTIDNDPPDLRSNGYYAKLALDDPDWLRFSNLHCLTNSWHENRNIISVAIPQDYTGNHDSEVILRDDYKVVLLSNSRWESFKQWRNQIDLLFDNLENPWMDLTVWYMALRKLILEGDLTQGEKVVRNSCLHQFFYIAAQRVKYEAILSLKTDRTVEVYGDTGWVEILKDRPGYYKGSLNNDEINELFRHRDGILFLLANCSYTYPDASGPVYDMIRRGVHWINVPPVARTKVFDGMTHIEYSNPKELNDLIENGRLPFQNAKGSLENYRSFLQESTEQIISMKESPYVKRVFLDHEEEMDKVLTAYIDKNEPTLRQSFNMFRW